MQEIVEPPVRPDPLRVRVAHQRDHRPCQRDGHVQRSRIGESTSAAPSRMPTSLPQSAAPSSDGHRHPRLLLYRCFRRELARRPPADEYRLEPEVAPQHVGHLGPPLGEPVLSPACSSRRRSARSDGRTSRAAPAARYVPPATAQIPHRLAVRHADRIEELEVLILHVLPRARRQAVRREQPVQVARPARDRSRASPARARTT
jgi:hypothetical protein